MRKDFLNSRGYAIHLNIAKNAFKTLQQLKRYDSNHELELSDSTEIFFPAQELRIICIDYAFASLENFLEHVGFILFDDWDSNEKQRHYNKKQKKLLSFSEITNKLDFITDEQYELLKKEWLSIIQTIDLNIFSRKRNPIKHTHTGQHDVKIIKSNSKQKMNPTDYAALVDNTPLEFTNEQCEKNIKISEDFISQVHSYITKNKFIFCIYQKSGSSVEKRKREMLLNTFLNNPLAATMYSSVNANRDLSK